MFGKKEIEPDLVSYVIYDSKAQTYGLPMLEKNSEVIIRELLTTFKKPEQQATNHLFINAEDYSLFINATYDRKTGTFTPRNPEHVINLHDVRAKALAAATQKPDLGIVPT